MSQTFHGISHFLECREDEQVPSHMSRFAKGQKLLLLFRLSEWSNDYGKAGRLSRGRPLGEIT